MRTLLILAILLSGCAATERYGKESKVKYAGYSYSAVYVRSPLGPINLEKDVIRNVQFCMEIDSSCRNVFQTNEQYIPELSFIDRNDPKGNRKRVFLFGVFYRDSNGDGNVTTDDLSIYYAYEPRPNKLVTLQKDVHIVDMKSVVDTYTFFVKYVKDDTVYVTQYDLSTLKPIETIVSEESKGDTQASLLRRP